MANPDVSNITELIKGCRKNRSASQKALYRAYYAYGMGICLRYANDQDEASEILNDSFMKVFSNIRKFDISRPFLPWFKTVTVNTAINHWRKKNRERMESIEPEESLASIDEEISAEINYQEILELLQKVPPAYRMAFNLFVIEGYSHEEISEQLGISVGTSKSNLFKAKKHLKALLNQYFTEDYVRAV